MKKLFRMQLMLMLVTMIFFSCDNDNDEAPKELLPKLDGFYVYGTNTVAESAVDPNARMARAILDHNQGAKVENIEGVYGKFLYIGANSKIKFAEVVNEVGTSFGAAQGGSVDSASVVGNVPLKDVVIHGTLEAGAPEIQVAEEGLYYAFVNTATDLFILTKVKANMIGDATERQWSAGTSLTLKSISKDSVVFEGANIPLKGASGYRYRFNDGWHVYKDPNVVTLSSLGVENYGTAWDTGINDVGFFLDNIPHKENGMFTIRLKFDASTGEWEEKKIKIGNLLINYSNTKMGLFGNAYVLSPGDTANWASGEDGYGLHIPSKSGNVYTWTWNDVSLIQAREFIFLEDGKWGGLLIDYTGASVQGTAIANNKIVDATSVGGQYHNFYVSAGGAYDITLVINAEANTKTITLTPN